MHAGIALRRGGGIKGTRLFMRTIQEFNRKIGGVGLALTPLGYPARLLGADETYESVTDKIGGIVLEHPRRRTWWAAFLPAFTLAVVLVVALTYLVYRGVGIWGINMPVACGFAIINFVCWMGIGHA